uniref:Uncharacterized protein n=1 Tax=Micrurus lemniscatus lemniscatus TaxID=129467 RepID=A0A2D4IHE8_MICLE
MMCILEICVKARKYWSKIHTWLEKMIKQHIDLKPEIFLLGIMPEGYDKGTIYLILHVLTTVRIVFAQYWKNENTPSDEDVIQKILDCAEMDRLTLKIKDKEDTEYYQHGIDFMNG